MSINVPLPALICRSVAVRAGPSTSAALASNCAWVIRRAPLSSAIAVRVTGVVVGASLTGVISRLALPAALSEPSLTV
ncbi:hypothetical protein D9M70_511100 [compost metagenome]